MKLKEKLDRILGLTGGVSNSMNQLQKTREITWANVNTESVADEPVIQSAEASVGRVKTTQWITSRNLNDLTLIWGSHDI